MTTFPRFEVEEWRRLVPPRFALLSRAPAGVACASFLMLTCISAVAAATPVELTLQARAVETGGIVARNESVDPAKIGIVIIDMWNTNDCMTNAQRAAALVPRMNKALEAARHHGMQIIWAPTDVASQYVGTPQRERAIALPRDPLPRITNFSCPFSVGTVRPAKCMCGPGIVCHVHYGWDQMDPNLVLSAGDWIVGDPQELYAVYKQRGLTRLIYMGINTNLSVMKKPEGIAPMTSAGLKCILARDLTDAETLYDPEHAYTPDIDTEKDVADIERSGVPSINMLDEMRRAGEWNDKWVVEKVLMAPWGTEAWPYLFTDSVKVTLTTYEQKGAVIRYALDRSEPSAAWPIYTKPLDITKTTHLRTAAFQNGRLATIVSDGEFVHLGALPPKPKVYLDELKPLTPVLRPNWRWEAKINLAFTGAPLNIRDATYSKGIGMRASANLLYIDGRLESESPIMRLSQEPWRFDVSIPAKSRLINLVVTGVGSHSPLDLANWVDAGFVLKR